MFAAASGKIWVYIPPADMRKQFDGLAALVQGKLGVRANRGDWFVFVNKRRTQMKILYYHQGGYCLWGKRLERGTYAKVSHTSDSLVLNHAQLQCLIDGIYWQKDKQNRRLNPLNLL